MELLKQSKEALLRPTKQAKRKLVIIMNCVFVLAMPSWLSLEGAHTGMPMAELTIFIYIPSFFLNLFSLFYNSTVVYMELKGKKQFTGIWYSIVGSKKARFDSVTCHASMYSIMSMSFIHIMGIGNPHSDAILTDYALSHLLIVIAVLVTGKRSAIIWSAFVVFALFYNVYLKGWDYKFHYMTPSEVNRYEDGLKNQEPWALERQEEVKANGITPPSIKRYFNVWLILVLIALSMALYFWDTITKTIPEVIKNLNQAMTDTHTINAKLAREEQANRIFINIGHELKTPLTMTQNFLMAYEQKQGTDKDLSIAMTYLNLITRNLVNALDMERFNKDGLVLFNHDQLTNVSDLLAATIDIFEPSATQKGIHLYKTIAPKQYIKADPVAIQRVINNLLENAIKYSKSEDSITVTLFEKEGAIKLIVSDTGIGIATEHQGEIFEPFRQLHSKNHNIDGMGLGLFLVKQIVNELKGDIDLVSTQTHGSSFAITLPCNVETGIDYEITSIPEPILNYLDVNDYHLQDNIHDPEKPYILLVEDQLGLLNFMSEQLAEDYNIHIARDGAEAIIKLDQGIIVDVIISDIMMPKVDGIALREYVNEHASYAHIPFIFLTAKTDDVSILKGLATNAINYLPKPFKMPILKKQIEVILTYNERQQRNITDSARSWIVENGFKTHSPIIEGLQQASIQRFNFTRKESEVVQHILDRKSNKEIAELLHVALTTVKKHISNVMKKAEVKTQKELRDKIDGR